MAYVLFAGRSEVPAAAFFYRLRDEVIPRREAERILTYAPFVLNQESNRPVRFNRKVDTWSVVVNGSEIREVDIADAINGDALTWKLAMWGSHRDRRLLESICGRFETLESLASDRHLAIRSGFEPRKSGVLVGELVGKKRIRSNALRGIRHIFKFPESAFEPFPEELAHARPGRDVLPILVSRPPHILCDAARRFAVFSDKFIVVRARQPAIAGSENQADLLKVLSLYLSSDFVRYHQLLMSPQWGISFNRANLDTLQVLPVPVSNLNSSEWTEWLDLHSRLVDASPALPIKQTRSEHGDSSSPRQSRLFDAEDTEDDLAKLVGELNDRVYRLLGLRESERMLVEDFVHVRSLANKGKVVPEAAGMPHRTELAAYGKVLKSELDEFFENDPQFRHRVAVWHDEESRTGMVHVELLRNHHGRLPVNVERADGQMSPVFQRARRQMLEQRSQWLYFERNLRLYEGSQVFVMKPPQRVHWLRSQALLDADTIIAETLAAGGK